MPIVRDDIMNGHRLFAIEDIGGNRFCVTGFGAGGVVLHTDAGNVDLDNHFPVSIDLQEVEQLVAFLSQVVEDGQAAEDAA